MAKGQQRIEQGSTQAEEGQGEEQMLRSPSQKGAVRGLDNMKN